MLSIFFNSVNDININIVECKFFCNCLHIIRSQYININIVECKLMFMVCKQWNKEHININIVECKS